MNEEPGFSDVARAGQLYQQFRQDVLSHIEDGTLGYEAPARSVRNTWQRMMNLAFPSATVEIEGSENYGGADFFNTSVRFENGDVLKLAIYLNYRLKPLQFIGALGDFAWSGHRKSDLPETLPMFIAKLDELNLMQRSAYALNRVLPMCLSADDRDGLPGLFDLMVLHERVANA